MADSKPDGVNGAMSTPPAIKVTAQQLIKLRDANTKYKNLLKMAKERIEKQEEELKRLRGKLRSASCVAQQHVYFAHLKQCAIYLFSRI
jgi:hypothetical protein